LHQGKMPRRSTALNAAASRPALRALQAGRRNAGQGHALVAFRPALRGDGDGDRAATGATIPGRQYALLERLLFSIYALISPDDPPTCFRRFYKLRTLSLRRELIEDAAKKHNLHALLQRALKRLLRRFEGAADRRTEIAHCAYLADGTTLVRLRTIRGEPRYEVITPAIFMRTFSQYHALNTDMLTFSALVAGSVEHVNEVTRAIPRAPELQPGPDIQVSTTSQQDVDDTLASLARLGLNPAEADALLLAAAARPPRRINGALDQ
jgi:hypothetical protein